MGVEFRLGHQDHKKVEDFLSRSPAGVSSIVLDTKAARHQTGAAEAARDANADVIFTRRRIGCAIARTTGRG